MDYLENLKTKSNLDGSALTRESIYVKFDPLVSKPSPKVADEHVHLDMEYGRRFVCVCTYMCTYINVDEISHIISTMLRDLLLLDTPPHCLVRVQPSHREEYNEASVFSPVSNANDHVRP